MASASGGGWQRLKRRLNRMWCRYARFSQLRPKHNFRDPMVLRLHPYVPPEALVECACGGGWWLTTSSVQWLQHIPLMLSFLQGMVAGSFGYSSVIPFASVLGAGSDVYGFR
ncbi:hypothetical protein [Oryza sativa Japonica Group]|uniref:Uncharacterized protein n=5 Tax=Oryza TaxID=4527 RepID=Q5ZDW6_ORYSJ|nr:hypothetical protein [Oryza sativa Japonica Group]